MTVKTLLFFVVLSMGPVAFAAETLESVNCVADRSEFGNPNAQSIVVYDRSRNSSELVLRLPRVGTQRFKISNIVLDTKEFHIAGVSNRGAQIELTINLESENRGVYFGSSRVQRSGTGAHFIFNVYCAARVSN